MIRLLSHHHLFPEDPFKHCCHSCSCSSASFFHVKPNLCRKHHASFLNLKRLLSHHHCFPVGWILAPSSITGVIPVPLSSFLFCCRHAEMLTWISFPTFPPSILSHRAPLVSFLFLTLPSRSAAAMQKGRVALPALWCIAAERHSMHTSPPPPAP